MSARIAVVGSVNLDLVATAQELPKAGETVTGATYQEHPGGKGANQALAARRLGAEVQLIARVGADGNASAALTLLKQDGVDLSGCLETSHAPTGVALIAVDAHGENQIIVASGANAALKPADLPAIQADALIAQLEVPVETVAAAAQGFTGLTCLNLAPALEVPQALLEAADVIVVNESEAAVYGARLNGLKADVVTTLGARGAVLRRGDAVIAEARPPAITPVDATGAGDTFVAAFVVARCEGVGDVEALAFACAAGAATATKPGAQSSLPQREEVERLLSLAPSA